MLVRTNPTGSLANATSKFTIVNTCSASGSACNVSATVKTVGSYLVTLGVGSSFSSTVWASGLTTLTAYPAATAVSTTLSTVSVASSFAALTLTPVTIGLKDSNGNPLAAGQALKNGTVTALVVSARMWPTCVDFS